MALSILLSGLGWTPVWAGNVAVRERGATIALNGREIPVNWLQWHDSRHSDRPSVGVADLGLMRSTGIELLDTPESGRQPVRWFAWTPTLPAFHQSGDRYLDITELARQLGWQVQNRGTVLELTSPPATLRDVETTPLPDCGGTPGRSVPEEPLPCRRFVLEFDRPVPWQAPQIETAPIGPSSSLPPDLQKLLIPPEPPETEEESPEVEGDGKPTPQPQVWWSVALDARPDPKQSGLFYPINGDPLAGIWIDARNQPTRLIFSTPPGWRPRVSSSGDPPRLAIEIRPDFWVERDIQWAPGLRWQQRYVEIRSPHSPALLPRWVRFPVVWLEIDLKSPAISLEPIRAREISPEGLAPLAEVAGRAGVAAAINGGFFNRNNQFPLGAIRHQNRWLSGPILGRGAIAWNDQKQVFIDRLTLTETLILPGGESVPIQKLNSAYIRAGLSRYTPDWGDVYRPFGDREIALAVRGDRIVGYQVLESPHFWPAPIPPDGYLLVLRNQPELATLLAPGTPVQLETATRPAPGSDFPHGIGAGPLLLRDHQIVLDAKAEQFGDAFNRQKAIRSAVGLTTGDRLLLAIVHQDPGGTGPSLAELAELMRQLGAVDALNLDGGSSSGLYLGGQLIDRPPQTAAPIHNGIGVRFVIDN
ncbi:MAG: phosphodiester glycosidase family protein [Limnospira sp.]